MIIVFACSEDAKQGMKWNVSTKVHLSKLSDDHRVETGYLFEVVVVEF